MSFMVTAIGDELDLRHPHPAHVTLMSIAWSLGQKNRFGGHALRPYSVAEHSLLVSDILERELLMTDPSGVLGGLMHDGHESITGDIATPAKREIEGWPSFERRFEDLVHRRFGLQVAMVAHRDSIRRADLMALATERRDLMPRTPTAWPALEGVEPVTWVDLYSPERRAMSWEDWRDRFLDRFHELDYARAHHPSLRIV